MSPTPASVTGLLASALLQEFRRDDERDYAMRLVANLQAQGIILVDTRELRGDVDYPLLAQELDFWQNEFIAPRITEELADQLVQKLAVVGITVASTHLVHRPEPALEDAELRKLLALYKDRENDSDHMPVFEAAVYEAFPGLIDRLVRAESESRYRQQLLDNIFRASEKAKAQLEEIMSRADAAQQDYQAQQQASAQSLDELLHQHKLEREEILARQLAIVDQYPAYRDILLETEPELQAAWQAREAARVAQETPPPTTQLP